MHVDKLSIFDQNCVFIGAQYVDFELPKDLMFLKKYFKTKIQHCFLQYYYFVGCKDNFSDHTGYKCDKSFIHKMVGKYDWLMNTFDLAKKNFDLETIGKLQMKKIKLLKKFC